MFFRRVKYRRVRVKTIPSKHYLEHREVARGMVHERLEYWNGFYNLKYNRVSIKNQKTCWGSCSGKNNLNFNYKIIFLPQPLMDYVIIHELCHLKEMNHSRAFWGHVAKTVPDHKEKRRHLRKMTSVPQDGFPSSLYVVGLTA